MFAELWSAYASNSFLYILLGISKAKPTIKRNSDATSRLFMGRTFQRFLLGNGFNDDCGVSFFHGLQCKRFKARYVICILWSAKGVSSKDPNFILILYYCSENIYMTRIFVLEIWIFELSWDLMLGFSMQGIMKLQLKPFARKKLLMQTPFPRQMCKITVQF